MTRMEKVKEYAIAALVVGVFAMCMGFLFTPPVIQAQQPPTLIYGQNGGTIKAIATDSSGRVNTVLTATNDPCMDPNVVKASAVVNIASATTTQIVALASGNFINVCAWALTVAGTAPSYQFEYGTGASCGTGTTVLTGTFLPTVGSFTAINGDVSLFRTAASNALCIVSAGTGPSIQGVVTYVQQ